MDWEMEGNMSRKLRKGSKKDKDNEVWREL